MTKGTTMKQWMVASVATATLALTAVGCGERNDQWSEPLGDPNEVGLTGSIALQDENLDRVLFVTVPEKKALAVDAVAVGQNVEAMVPSVDAGELFVLSRGIYPRTNKDDERPRLMVLDGGASPEDDDRVLKTFEFDDPKEQLALDPSGDWIAAYGGGQTVTNVNELVLCSLEGDEKEGEPISKPIRSFGGAPEELLFTDELHVPEGGARRFLIVRTDRDVTLVDLKNLDNSEVTIKLPEDSDGRALQPAQIVYDDGEEDVNTDARLAIRLEGSADVVIAELGKANTEEKDFSVVVNIVDVGGVPTSIDFVRTDGGLRLAALVPDAMQATLVNPKTTLAEEVELPYRFTQMTRITSLVSDAPDGGDVALLWGSDRQIAFWSLGSTSATPYRSIDTTELTFSVQDVLDVPAPNAHLKMLTGGSAGLFVLDLKKRQSFPLSTTLSSPRLEVAADGERVWVYQDGLKAFSSVVLEDLHPLSLYVEPGVANVFDIERGNGEGRAAVALHLDQGWSATVLDAEAPDSAETKYYPAIHLEGLR